MWEWTGLPCAQRCARARRFTDRWQLIRLRLASESLLQFPVTHSHTRILSIATLSKASPCQITFRVASHPQPKGLKLTPLQTHCFSNFFPSLLPPRPVQPSLHAAGGNPAVLLDRATVDDPAAVLHRAVPQLAALPIAAPPRGALPRSPQRRLPNRLGIISPPIRSPWSGRAWSATGGWCGAWQLPAPSAWHC